MAWHTPPRTFNTRATPIEANDRARRNLSSTDNQQLYRDRWSTIHRPLLFGPGPIGNSKIVYLQPNRNTIGFSAGGSKRFPTLNPKTADNTDTLFKTDTVSNLWTFLPAFNKSQKGEVIEAFANEIYRKYKPHAHDDYIVDGYDMNNTVNTDVALQRYQQLRQIGPAVARLARDLKNVWIANTRGVFEPQHGHMLKVPIEWKWHKEGDDNNKFTKPSIAQLLYLWMFQGKLMYAGRYDDEDEIFRKVYDLNRWTIQDVITYLERAQKADG